MEGLEPGGERGEAPVALRGGPDQDAPAVGGVGEPLGEAGLLQAVEQAGGVGGPVEQAVGNRAGRDAGLRVVGQAQRPERDVLGVGQGLGAADLLELVE